jgi:hypothetical protein
MEVTECGNSAEALKGISVSDWKENNRWLEKTAS